MEDSLPCREDCAKLMLVSLSRKRIQHNQCLESRVIYHLIGEPVHFDSFQQFPDFIRHAIVGQRDWRMVDTYSLLTHHGVFFPPHFAKRAYSAPASFLILLNTSSAKRNGSKPEVDQPKKIFLDLVVIDFYTTAHTER